MNDLLQTTRHHSPQRRRAAFTLIEIMTVLVIATLLIGLVIAGLNASRKSATRIKMQSDLQVIGGALEEYKKDHGGMYPQVTAPNTGFAVLGRELIGIYGDGVLPPNTPGGPSPPDANDPPQLDGTKTYVPGECINQSNFYVCLEDDGNPQPAPPNTRYWAPFNPRDGEDGPGHRAGGRKFPNYLQPEKFRVRGCAILDGNDKPILYFPARGNPNINMPGANGTASYVALPIAGNPKYHVDDNWQFFTRPDVDPLNTNAEKRVQAMMGDTDYDGKIGTGETAVTSAPYVLWTAGADGFYGPWWNPTKRPATDAIKPDDITRCDDVTNWQK